MSDYYQRDPRGHPSSSQRDAAFSNIFGAVPPPGRSQTMTSSSVPPQMMSQGRTQTMQSNMSGMPPSMQRQPPPRQPIPNQYGDRQPLSPRTRTMDGDASAGGVYPGQSSNNSAGMVARRRLDPTPVVLLKGRPEREPPLSASTKAALPRA
ncbi:hypothetical protein BN1708_002526 [Verticillium longisporum]|uniref:Uncharacterized protein n=1 Tax=Verticillium longisporum TaxID=100787 RepID=A0A0G4KTP0_VERLO|nr:hypothetical protein BN1708_002526 [Verticillium longisporum]